MHTKLATQPRCYRFFNGFRAILSAIAVAGVSLGFLNGSPASASTLAAWDVSGATGYGASPLAATTSDANLTVGGLTRGSGVTITGTAAARCWGGNNWVSTTAAAAVTANQFATFTVTANSGKTVSFSSISKFDYRRSGTGAASGTLQYQIGTGTFTDIATLSYSVSTSTGGSIAAIDLTSIPALQNVAAGTTVTFRIVNYGGTSASGTWYIFDKSTTSAADFEIQGTVQDGITATQVGVETLADGSGTVQPAASVVTGSPLTVYAVSRSSTGAYVANAAATWSLTSITDGVVAGDLVAAADNKSATFTPHAAGSAIIHATISGLTSVDSGVITATSTPTNPTVTGGTIASSPGLSVQLSATVVPGANPTSTSLTVVGDLTAINGSASQTFTAGANNTFTFQTTLPTSLTTGSKVIPITVTDAEGRTGTASITVNVAGSVTIFHMNDTHARVTPHWWVIPDHNATLEPKFELVGGAAYLGAKVLSLTAANPDSLVIDGGDISEGNPIGDMGGNGTMVRFYRLLSQKLKTQRGRGIDAVVVGNHDVRDTTYVANLKNQTDFTPISVNVCALGTKTPYFAPYVIVNVNGVKVGILGYTTQSAEVGASLASTLDVVGCDWNGTDTTVIHLADYVKELRNTQGCDVVVLAAHVGHSALCTDTGTSGAVKAILVDDGAVKLPEIAITGHWHTWAETVWQPEVLNYKTIFAESSSYMHYVGEVKISSTGKYLDSAQHVVRCADITPDADINSLLDTFKAEYAAANPTKPIAEIVGYTGDNLLLDNYMKWWSGDEYPWTGDNTAGEWICDAMQWKATQLFGHCDLALEAGGGVRADIPKGSVTYSQVYETFPWVDDTYMRIQMTGQEIYNYFKDHNCNAAFSRGWVVTVEDGAPTLITYNGQPIGLTTSYDVAINNYMYAHDTSHTWVDTTPEEETTTTKTLVRDSLIEFMKQTTSPDKPYLSGSPRFAINTEFSGGYRAVVTLLNDHDTKTSYEAAYIRLLSATPETLARRGGKQVPSDLVNADGSIAPSHSLSEIELYRSYLGFKQGALQPGDIIETWGKGSFYDGEPEFVDQEGIYADGVEFKIVGHDASLAQPTFMPSIGAFWDGDHKNHFVRFLAKKAGADTVTDQFGQTIKVWDVTAYTSYSLPGNTGDLLVLTGVTCVKNFGMRFCGASAALASTQGFSTFPVTSSLASHIDPLPPGNSDSTLTLTATATSASTTGITLSPVADAQVVSLKSTTNYGTGTNLYVQSAAAGSYGNERSWLRFDLSSLPAGTTITGATLELYCFKAAGAALQTTVSGCSDDTWGESTLTWATQPTAIGSALDTQTLAAATTTVWYKWNVTSFVQSELAGDKLASFVAKAATENSTDATSPSYAFDAKEYGSNSPVLRITTAASSTTTVASVQFFYRYSADNTTWGAWTPFATASAAPYSVSFNYPQIYGYYEFYSVATDSLGAAEAAPLAADVAVHHTAAPAYSTEAIVRLADLAQTYSGGTKPVTVTTIPGGLNLAVTYNGLATAPVNAGSYTVVATVINQPGYTGSATGTLAVAKLSQTITFDSIEPKTTADAPFALSGSTSSGLGLTYTSSNPAVATVAGSTVTIVGAGTTTITANQIGNSNVEPAASVSQTLTVTSATLPNDGSDVPAMPLWAMAALAAVLFYAASRLLKQRTQHDTQ